MRVRSLFGQEAQAARDALRLKPTKMTKTADATGATTNDAAEDLARGAEEDAASPVKPPVT